MGSRSLDSASDGSDASEDTLALASRAYQLEMFEESKKKNIIVAMDTGTGKTRVAILRIRVALEQSSPDQAVWFLAPSILLCHQQFHAISLQLPAVQVKLLTSESNVDAWSTQAVWDHFLLNVRVVVATHQVLLEALQHGFVKLRSIALLVFDEAHSCVKASPGKRIMSEFYHPAKEQGQSYPAVLGLTASPIQGRKLDGIEELEHTLDALCTTPTRHRDELLAHTKLPSTHIHLCEVRGAGAPTPPPGNLQRLSEVFEAQQRQQQQQGYLEKKGGPYRDIQKADEFVKSFHRRASVIGGELGPWAAEYYVHRVVSRCTHENGKLVGSDRRTYLLSLLRKVQAAAPPKPSDDGLFEAGLSVKVQKLMEILQGYQDSRATCIVFVKERPMAAVLAHVISVHPGVKTRFQAAHVVGMSQMQADRFDSVLVLNPKSGHKALQEFRTGKRNLLVSTSVIEEGIDVPACNVVVCMDDLTNLKGYIQRRGRAREDKSQFHLLVGPGEGRAVSGRWASLERAMKQRYDELREGAELQGLEGEAAASELSDSLLPPLCEPKTGARLPAKAAKSHLQHFCATLSSAAFVESRPIYILDRQPDSGLLQASVQLPITLPPHLRRAYSVYAWRSEANACIDAALSAYKQIHAAGLLTDNLLPPKLDPDLDGRYVEGRPGMVPTQDEYRPWPAIAAAWAAGETRYKHAVRLLDSRGATLCEADLVLPRALVDMQQAIKMYWSPTSQRPWTVEIGPARSGGDDEDDDTVVLLTAAYGHRWPITDGQHRLVRFVCPGEQLGLQHIGAVDFAPELFASGRGSSPSSHAGCLVRDRTGTPYVYQTWLAAKPAMHLVRKPDKNFDELPEDAAYAVLRPWPKQVGFLHPPTVAEDPTLAMQAPTKPYPRVVPADECKVDLLPMSFVHFGALIPSLMPVIEANLVAGELLASTRLRALTIRDRSLVVTAISAPAARLSTNYEKLEFVGDAVLKMHACVNCAAQNIYAPEGHLSLLKDRLVANSRLCRAALDLGLDRFIVTTHSSLRRWRKLCDGTDSDATEGEAGGPGETGEADETAEGKPKPRMMSTKTLADVVEALIGACQLDGGEASARQCISQFLPDHQWLSLEAGRALLFEAAPEVSPWTPPAALETLLGYSFRKPSLLAEAMTHASVPSGQDEGGCMERLEFLGDAILDYIIMQRLLAARRPLSHQTMHLLRTTLGNANMLGFVAMEFCIHEVKTEVATDGTVAMGSKAVPVWMFMRDGSSRDMAASKLANVRRHAALRAAILEALWRGPAYPWPLLVQLRMKKFFSDLMEALIGAVWVDSGSLEAVELLLHKVGLLPYLERAVEETLHLMHPKEELGAITGSVVIDYPRVEILGRDEARASEVGESGESESESDEGEESEESESEGEDVKLYACRLLMNGHCVAEVLDAQSQYEAETRAADMALRQWKAGQLMWVLESVGTSFAAPT